ncbi:hypothetical protein D3C80_2126160 [compost metagenome]
MGMTFRPYSNQKRAASALLLKVGASDFWKTEGAVGLLGVLVQDISSLYKRVR